MSLTCGLITVKAIPGKEPSKGQQAMMSKQRADADEPHQQMTGGITQRDTADLSGVEICLPELPA